MEAEGRQRYKSAEKDSGTNTPRVMTVWSVQINDDYESECSGYHGRTCQINIATNGDGTRAMICDENECNKYRRILMLQIAGKRLWSVKTSTQKVVNIHVSIYGVLPFCITPQSVLFHHKRRTINDACAERPDMPGRSYHASTLD